MRHSPPDHSFEITGVVKDAQNRNLTQELMPEVYWPYTIPGFSDRLAVLQQIRAVDAQQPVTNVMTIDRPHA